MATSNEISNFKRTLGAHFRETNRLLSEILEALHDQANQQEAQGREPEAVEATESDAGG